MDTPLCIDLCCGTGGWTDAFLRKGWRVIGFDIRRDRRYKGQLVLQDVRTLDGTNLRYARIIVASPPCTEFSQARIAVHGRPSNPDLSIIDACFRIAADAQAPLVLENVHGAQQYIGPAAHHFGHFYLWGDGVPALLPAGPLWKDRQKGWHRSPHLRARIPDDLANAIAHHYSGSLVHASPRT